MMQPSGSEEFLSQNGTSPFTALPRELLLGIVACLSLRDCMSLASCHPSCHWVLTWDCARHFFPNVPGYLKYKGVYYEGKLGNVVPQWSQSRFLVEFELEYHLNCRGMTVSFTNYQEFLNNFVPSSFFGEKMLFPRFVPECSNGVFHTGKDCVVELGGLFYPRLVVVKCGYLVDVMDKDGVWYEGVVVMTEQSAVAVKVEVWPERPPRWYDLADPSLAPFRTFTEEWRSRLQPGSKVEVYCFNSWHLSVVEKRKGDQLTMTFSSTGEKCVRLFYQKGLSPPGVHCGVDGGGYRTRFRALDHPAWEQNKFSFHEQHVFLRKKNGNTALFLKKK